MQIRQLTIERFRGIRHMDWPVVGNVICLIGPGDSTKSTILDAIDLALSPRWKIDFDDSDFYDSDTSKDIEITVTVGALTEQFKAADKFGLELRGWNSVDGLHDEPTDDDELVLSIQLKVNSSLEPQWLVINDRNPEGRPISSQDRDLIGVARIGDFLDRHLTWSRGSALSRFTGKGDDLAGILAEASRAARRTLKPEALPLFRATADRLAIVAKAIGVVPRKSYSPHLDNQAADVRAGGLALHDGEIPVRRNGLGTRRLLAVALQREVMKDGGIALVDEVESGLEPHRLRNLLRVLQSDCSESSSYGQIFMTTHSPIVIDELKSDELRIVRSHDGVTEVFKVPIEVQTRTRKVPEAFLGSKLLVCEGDTEIGFCRALDRWWTKDDKYNAFSVMGVVLVDGVGVDAPRCAQVFANLGYNVGYLGDSDCQLNPDAPQMRGLGITVTLWADSTSIEQRIAIDIPWAGLQEILQLAVELHNEGKIRSAVIGKHGTSSDLQGDLTGWKDTPELRAAIGAAAKGGEWFKSLDWGERLGVIVTKYLSKTAACDLELKIQSLREWIDHNG